MFMQDEDLWLFRHINDVRKHMGLLPLKSLDEIDSVSENTAKNITMEFPDADKEIDLKPMYNALYKALSSFRKLCESMRKTGSQTNESVIVARLSDYADEIKETQGHIKSVKDYIIGDSVIDGIRCPSELTMYRLDGCLENIDKFMESDNRNFKTMFQEIKDGVIHFQDIVEFEKFFKNIYMELCSCVLAYYNSAIIAIGNTADFEHSNQYLIDYFNKKNIKNGTSNYPLIPATKNVFGELIHEKATGTTSTVGLITRKDFNDEIAKRQAKNKLLQNQV